MLEAFHWVIYVFGAILLLTGIKLLRAGTHEEHPERNPVFRWLSRVIPSTSAYHGQKFFVRVDGKRLATPLFMVLVLIEITDVIFAIDSIPAIFAVTNDPFIVYTSNIFAILGLRSLYFCISGFVSRLKFLKTGLALVLIFVAGKMLAVRRVQGADRPVAGRHRRHPHRRHRRLAVGDAQRPAGGTARRSTLRHPVVDRRERRAAAPNPNVPCSAISRAR